MRKWLILAFLCVLSSFAYAATYNQTVLWADEFDEDGAPTAGNDVTDLIDGTGEMGAASCDLSSIVAAAAGQPVTVTSAGFGFYTSTGSGSPIQYWELDNSINGSQLDSVCAGAFCPALESAMISLVGIHTGADAAGVWEWYGVNESAMANLFETYINAGEMNVSIIKNISDPTGADFENVRGLDYATTSQRPRCFVEYTIASVPKTLYVDVDSIGGACSDAYTRAANDITHPWCTLQEGLDNWQDGDTLYLRGGNYTTFSDSYGAKVTSYNDATAEKILAGYPGEEAIITSLIDGCALSWNGTNVTLGALTETRWDAPYVSTSDYMRYKLGNKQELLAYDPDLGDSDSRADMDDIATPYGCFYDESARDLIECRLPKTYNPNTCGQFYFSWQTATLNFDNQVGYPIRIANLSIEAGRQGIYLRDTENVIIENVNVLGGEYGIRADRTYNTTVKDSYLHIDYIGDSNGDMAWTEHRKGESAETSAIFVNDDPEMMNLTNNIVTGHFNGILLYNNDGDSGFNGLDISYNYFSDIYDDAIELEGDGYTSRVHHNNVTDAFVCLSLHPYDDPTHSTVVDYNLCTDPKYELFYYSTNTYYYGEAIKMASSSDYTEGVNFDHNTFEGNGIKANTAQTNTQFYNNWTNNIFYTSSSSQYLITKTGESGDGVWYDYNLYYSPNYYFRYYGSDSISTTYYNLASAIASGRLAGQNANSIDADPQLQANFYPYLGSPVCGAASDGSDIGALACPGGGLPNIVLTVASPANDTVIASDYINITYSTDTSAQCNVDLYIEYASGYSLRIYNDTDTTAAGTPETHIITMDAIYDTYPLAIQINFYIECSKTGYSDVESGWYVLYIDTDEPVSTITHPISGYEVRKTTGEQWFNINASCYDQTLDEAQVYVINSTGSWYYSNNQTGLAAANVTTYNWNVNVSMASWPADLYTVYVYCYDVPSGSAFTGNQVSFQTNVTVVAYNSVYGHIEDWNLTIGSNWYNVNGTNGTIWVDTNTEYTFNGTDNLYTIVGKTVLINQTSAIINLTATLKNPTVDQCSGYYTYPVLNISYFSEQTGASINVTSAYSVYFYDGNATPSVQYLSYSNSAYTTFCTDVDPSFTTATLLFYGQAILSKTNYDTRIYNIPYAEGITVSNNPVKQYSMYLLPTANSTTVTYNWYTTSFVPINGNMLIYRCEADGTKTLVDAPLITDGVATANIQAYYTVYSYAVVIDGTTYLDDSYTACHTESLTERTYYVDILESPILPLADLYGASCRLQKTGANEVKLTWSADESVEACIIAERQTVAGSFQIYENCTTLQSGSMTRTIANNSNTYYVKGTISDGTYTAYCVDMVTITTKTDAQTTFGIFGAFATGLFILAIALLFLPDLQLSIVGSIIALIAAFLLGFIAFGWGAVFMLIVFLIAVMWIGRYNRKQ